MRLNLMCGDDYREGYVNVDLRGDCQTDLRCDASRLPIEDGDVDEVLVLDGLEHFPADRTDEILSEWARVLRPGGALTVKVPNMASLCRSLVEYDAAGDHDSVVAVIRNLYGGHRWGPGGAYDAHHTGWTRTLIIEALDKAGFVVADCDEKANMRVVAVKR